MPLVDVVIPVYNTPHAFTTQALDSVLAQTHRDLHAVVVNDGSNEQTTRDLERLIAERADPRIVYAKSVNRGLPAARNLGIASSDAPYIALLDSDDVWYPHKLERQLAAWEAHPEADVLHACSDLVYGADMATLRRVPPYESGTNGLDSAAACARMLRSNFVAVNTVIFKRSAAAAVGFFDEAARTLEDKDLWVRMLLAGRRFHHVAETLAIYRVHGSSLSRNADKMRDGRLRIIAKMDALQGTGIGWIDRDWPALRREMLHHTYHEVAETYLESGQYLKALKHAMPWYSGVSAHSVKLGVKSALGALGVRREKAKAAS